MESVCLKGNARQKRYIFFKKAEKLNKREEKLLGGTKEVREPFR